MTPWRTYADPAVLDAARSPRQLHTAGRALRSEFPYAQVLRLPEHSTSVTGIVVPLVTRDDPDLIAPAVMAGGRVVLDVVDVDDSLPGPWEWDVVRAARSAGKPAAVRAFAAGYQAGIAAMAEEPLHAARSRAEGVAARLARGLVGASALEAERQLSRDGSTPRLRPDQVAQRWNAPVSAPLTDIAREWAQYRETVVESQATLLAHYREVDALGTEDGRLLVLLARGRGDLVLLEATPAAPSTWEPFAGAWRAGSDVQRVLLARETVPLAAPEMLGWSTSPDGAVARVWSRARALPRQKKSGGQAAPVGLGRRRRAHATGVVLGLVHGGGGDATTLNGYLGRSERFADALVEAVG